MVVEAIPSMLLEVTVQVVCTLSLHLEVTAQEREVTELPLAAMELPLVAMELPPVAMEVDTRVRCLVLHNTADKGAIVKAIDPGTDHFLRSRHGTPPTGWFIWWEAKTAHQLLSRIFVKYGKCTLIHDLPICTRYKVASMLEISVKQQFTHV
jgi:hypothetical protein